MNIQLLLGIDVGTSGCKMTVFSCDGDVLATTTEGYSTDSSHPAYAEQNPEEWWAAICRGLGKLRLGEAGVLSQVVAIGVAGQGWSCLPVDREGVPLHPAIIWLDRRAEEQVGWMRERAGESRLVQLSGNPVDPAYIVPKILWIKEHYPYVYVNASKFLQSNAYIVYRLTGVFSQDYSQAYGFHFFDMRAGRFDEGAADDLDVALNKVAPLYHCHDVVGTVTSEAARQTGLRSGTPVVAGGLDAACCTFGAGVVEPGQTQEQGGQAGGMSIQVASPLVHPRLILGYHVLPDQWLLQGGTVGGGGTLKWFHDQLGAHYQILGDEQGRSAFQVMSEEAGQISPGSDGLIFLPYMKGERSPLWDSKARGVLFGLSYNTTRAHMVRALMEGVGYSLLHNLQTAAEVGAVAAELTSVGGSANSTVWTQLKADIVQKPIHVTNSDHATTLGAALLAGLGVGVYPSFAAAVARTVRVTRTHVPNREHASVYSGLYETYLQLYQQVKGLFARLGSSLS